LVIVVYFQIRSVVKIAIHGVKAKLATAPAAIKQYELFSLTFTKAGIGLVCWIFLAALFAAGWA
jgi:hypothetical protein